MRFSHVGIYIGENRFVHAPKPGAAVSVVDMAHAYWQRKYNGARRVLSAASSAITATERRARFSPAAEGFTGVGEAEPFPPQ
ncbi:MAG TPA: NlpC/P60 family protein [Burkholderiaceae bacterium]|nr:NlpC/P60 family protein [Burkholderiaceae bacterium]